MNLSEQFESACAIAAQLRVDGADTTVADAEVERLLVLLDSSCEACGMPYPDSHFLGCPKVA